MMKERVKQLISYSDNSSYNGVLGPSFNSPEKNFKIYYKEPKVHRTYMWNWQIQNSSMSSFAPPPAIHLFLLPQRNSSLLWVRVTWKYQIIILQHNPPISLYPPKVYSKNHSMDSHCTWGEIWTSLPGIQGCPLHQPLVTAEDLIPTRRSVKIWCLTKSFSC